MPKSLLTGQDGWFETGLPDGPVISSRIRLARNLNGYAFPDWAGDEERIDIWQKLCSVFKTSEVLPESEVWGMDELSALEKGVLCERHLISRELSDRGFGSGVVIGRDEHVAVMINEEDHLRLQALEPGLDLKRAYEMLSSLDDRIEEHFSYAFSPKLGYLTACPSNVGTGLRASVMLHLPGLVLMEEMGPILNGISKIGLAVRGLWGEGSDASGNMFQISNQITLGKRENDIIEHLEQIVLEIVEHEQHARTRLLESRELLLRDHIGRAYGILQHARIVSSKEALDLLSAMRLGTDMGIIDAMERKEIDRLFIQIQPSHLQQIQQVDLDSDERDIARAELIRKILK
jgi:protein arginine kinase